MSFSNFFDYMAVHNDRKVLRMISCNKFKLNGSICQNAKSDQMIGVISNSNNVIDIRDDILKTLAYTKQIMVLR